MSERIKILTAGIIRENPVLVLLLGTCPTLAVSTSAINAIGSIAFTNINKVRGKEASKKEYHQLANTSVAVNLMKKEIEIINPKTIVCCGTARFVLPLLKDFSGRVIIMPHSGARKNTIRMLESLKEELDRN